MLRRTKRSQPLPWWSLLVSGGKLPIGKVTEWRARSTSTSIFSIQTLKYKTSFKLFKTDKIKKQHFSLNQKARNGTLQVNAQWIHYPCLNSTKQHLQGRTIACFLQCDHCNKYGKECQQRTLPRKRKFFPCQRLLHFQQYLLKPLIPSPPTIPRCWSLCPLYFFSNPMASALQSCF